MHALRTLHLFAGAGGGILADILLGHVPVCAVEIDSYCQQVLAARQKDGCLPWFPIFADVSRFDGRPWRGLVEIVAGGFPCQDISAAGKGAGIDGERSGLWREMARIIGEVRPRFVFVENSPMLTLRGLGRVLGDLSALGYDARWGVVSAAYAIWLAGDPCLYHERERIWIVGSDANRCEQRRRLKSLGESTGRNTNTARTGTRWETADSPRHGRHEGRTESAGEQGRFDAAECGDAIIDTDGDGWSQMEQEDKAATQGPRLKRAIVQRGQWGGAANWWQSEPDVGRVVDGLANRVDRLRAIGNGQVPAVARLAWLILTGQVEVDLTQ